MTDAEMLQMIQDAIAEIERREVLEALKEAGLDWTASPNVAWIDSIIAGLQE